MVVAPLAVTATPTVHLTDGGWNFLPPVAFAVLTLLASAGTVLVIRRRSVRAPWGLHLLLVPIVPTAVVYAGSAAVYGTADTYPVFVPFTLSVGGATLIGSSLHERRRGEFLLGAAVFVLPLALSLLLMDLGQVVGGYLLLGGALGAVAIVLGYLVGRWDARSETT